MKKLLVASLFFMLCLAVGYAYCEDNLLAVDVVSQKQEDKAEENMALPKEETSAKSAQPPLEEQSEDVDSQESVKRLKAYRELIDNKQKELEVIKLDLEKSSVLLKKKEAEKQIHEIEKVLPQEKKEVFAGSPLLPEAKPIPVEASEVKILLLLITDDLKEGIMTLKGATYGFREGDCIASKLTAERIEAGSVSFRQLDGTALKLNFIN